MYTKPKPKKTCRTAPVVIESKLKPLPNIGNATNVTSSETCKYRNSTSASKNCSRSIERTSRSGSVTERDTRSLRNGKVLQALKKKSRDSYKYAAYGRSSDPTFEDPGRRPLLPDPYADLRSNIDGGMPLDPSAPWWLFLAEMKLQARRQAINLDCKPEPQPQPQPQHQPHSQPQPARQGEKSESSGVDVKRDSSKGSKHDSKIDTRPDEEKTLGRNNSKSEDDSKNVKENDESSMSRNSEQQAREDNGEDSTGKEDATGQDDNNDNDEDEDEEEDEMGLPQAVRALLSKQVSLNAREVVRERHRAMMEEIARTVRVHKLMGHLKAEGFFNYDYSPHARTNMTNHNLRKGRKKGTERLLLLLACRPAKCVGELFGAF
ncbi:hypothetical protein BsWGS_27526 [Bradybaena similaris]